MSNKIELFFPKEFSEFFDDILIQANKDKAEKEKYPNIGSLIYNKVCEHVGTLYTSYLAWVPTHNFSNRRIDAAFTPFGITDLQDKQASSTDTAVTLVLSDRVLHKLGVLLAWIEAVEIELNKASGVPRNTNLEFKSKSDRLKNVIIEQLKPFLAKIEEEEKKAEEAEAKAAV